MTAALVWRLTVHRIINDWTKRRMAKRKLTFVDSTVCCLVQINPTFRPDSLIKRHQRPSPMRIAQKMSSTWRLSVAVLIVAVWLSSSVAAQSLSDTSGYEFCQIGRVYRTITTTGYGNTQNISQCAQMCRNNGTACKSFYMMGFPDSAGVCYLLPEWIRSNSPTMIVTDSDLFGFMCDKCPIGKYCANTTVPTSVPCGNGFTTAIEGATSLAQCNVCAEGSYKPAAVCVQCPAGYRCALASTATVDCAAGWSLIRSDLKY
jgi:hypothetical protein